MKPLRVASKQSNPRGEDHNAGTSIGIGHIACSTCAALSGTLMARVRGDGTWAMSLGVSNTPSTPARKLQRYCSLCTRNIPNQACKAAEAHRVTTTPQVSNRETIKLFEPRNDSV